MPRPYTLGKREGPKAEVRARIVAAALEIVGERGLAGASNLAIAKAADVAPATVRNHFPESRDLARAIIESILVDMDIPTPALFEGVDDLEARISLLAGALAAMYERSARWWRAYQREPELINAWSGGVDAYYADFERLMRAALGDLSTDERSVAVVSSIIGPPAYFGFRARGLSSEEAVRLTTELAVPWLERRRAEVARTSRGRQQDRT